jgi:colanic acid biosynthesis glycosyl transferase WcaI
MRIVLLSMNFAPELTGIGKYSGELAEGLLIRGHEVTVVCAPPYYPQWSFQGTANRYAKAVPKPGLTVFRCPIWLPRQLSGLKRLMAMASFGASSLPVLLRLVFWRPDVVVVVAPALFSAPAGWLTARLAGAKAWLHVQDLEVDAAFELGLLKGRSLRHLVQCAERLLLRRFDVVSTISARMRERLIRKGVDAGRSELFPNWVDLGPAGVAGRSPALREALKIDPETFVCLFSGTLNRKQGLQTLVEAARLLRDLSNVVFVICGNGELRDDLERAASDLSNVRFLDLRPAAEVNDLLCMADLHLLPQAPGIADLVMPSKLTGMLASARPVVAAANAGTETASIVRGCGLLTEPGNAAAMAAAIVELFTDPDKCVELGAAGRTYAERELDLKVVLGRLNSRLLALSRHPIPLVASSNDEP